MAPGPRQSILGVGGPGGGGPRGGPPRTGQPAGGRGPRASVLSVGGANGPRGGPIGGGPGRGAPRMSVLGVPTPAHTPGNVSPVSDRSGPSAPASGTAPNARGSFLGALGSPGHQVSVRSRDMLGSTNTAATATPTASGRDVRPSSKRFSLTGTPSARSIASGWNNIHGAETQSEPGSKRSIAMSRLSSRGSGCDFGQFEPPPLIVEETISQYHAALSQPPSAAAASARSVVIEDQAEHHGVSNTKRESAVASMAHHATRKQSLFASRTRGVLPEDLIPPTKMERVRAQVLRLVCSSQFDAFMGFFVGINAVMIALESEVRHKDGVDYYFRLSDYIFLAVFTFEFVLRVFALGIASLKQGAMMLDMVIVGTAWITEIVVPFALQTSGGGAEDLKVLQTLKVLRVLRAVRVLRMLTMFRDLWLVMESFFLCLKPLVWTVLFILIIIFLFAMLTVEFIGNMIRKEFPHDEKVQEISERFRSTVPAMFTLFQVMTLDTWHMITGPLFAVSGWMHIFFLIYIAVTSLVLMNLVTAVVVESAMNQKDEGEDYRKEVFDQQVEMIADEIEDMFEMIDEDGGGSIDQEEFVENAMRARLIRDICNVLGFTAEDMPMLYRILYSHEHGAQQEGDEDSGLDMPMVLQGMMQLQRIAAEQSTVALIRSARTEKEKENQLRSAMGEASCEFSKLRGSMQNQLDSVASHFEKLAGQSKQAQIVLKDLAKTAHSLSIGTGVPKTMGSSDMAVQSRWSDSSAKPMGLETSGAKLKLGSTSRSGNSIAPSSRGSLDGKVNEKTLQGLANLRQVVEQEMKDLRDLVPKAPPSAAAGFRRLVLQARPIESLCQDLCLPSEVQHLFEAEGITDAYQLCVLPSELVKSLLEKLEFPLTLGMSGRLFATIHEVREQFHHQCNDVSGWKPSLASGECSEEPKSSAQSSSSATGVQVSPFKPDASIEFVSLAQANKPTRSTPNKARRSTLE